MRRWTHYAASDWLALAPLRDGLRQCRNDLLQARYNRVAAIDQAKFLADAARFAGRQIALVVAFEQPWAVDWQLRMAARNAPGMPILIFDNSRTNELRRRIADVCRMHGAPYLALPTNRTQHPNRSHGMAMNWIWHNVVRAIQPKAFLFLDHDMIPVLPVDPFRHLDQQTVFGLLNRSRWGWQHWAGYCAFDFNYLAHRRINFLYDFSNGLDTGGRNWSSVYRHVDADAIIHAHYQRWRMPSPADRRPALIEVVDDGWFHISSISYNDNVSHRGPVCEWLAAELDRGTSWHDLVGPHNAEPAPR